MPGMLDSLKGASGFLHALSLPTEPERVGSAAHARLVVIPGRSPAFGRTPARRIGFTITRGKIVEIDLLAELERLRQLDVAILND